jgi:hypothetical protein
MTNKLFISCILPPLLWFCSPIHAMETLHQKLEVKLQPQAESLQVSVQLTLPKNVSPNFLLHRGLNPISQTPGVRIEETEQIDGPVPLAAYRVQLPDKINRFTLTYGGRISHHLTRLKESPGRSRERLAGTISSQGIHLDAATGWYPQFPGSLQSFTLEAELPDGWLAVSQGAGPETVTAGRRQHVVWQESQPQDEIYLIAAPFQFYQRQVGEIEAQVFLRQADEALANRYLSATEHYLQLYQKLIGPYPYAKFALVENFWETGYGMPSFTLLGSRVIRLPFILHTSYPHEILHNWWGNSVYVDYASGNWSEGLTSYLADHLLAEQQGRGSEHRRSALQRYVDFVRHDNDFPLSEFQARHSTASQAVGYNKSLMLFHMLRRKLGDERFIDGVRRFYRDNRFQTAGFPQLQAAFEAAGETSLGDFFHQWVERTGAPSLALEQVRIEITPRGYRLSGALRQTQKAAPFHLRVPLVIGFEDGAYQAEQVDMTQRQQAFRFDLAATPLSLSVDPWFDLFRALDPAETPPSLSQFFGAERVLILLPAAADKTLRQGYRALATAWAEDYPEAEILLDRELDHLPDDRPVLLLGWENRFTSGFLDALADYPLSRKTDSLSLWNESYDEANHSFALAHRPDGSAQTRLWIATRTPESLAGLARKLPHYGKYSALAFSGKTPDNRLKRQWPVIGSPLQATFTKTTLTPLPEPPPLTADLGRP